MKLERTDRVRVVRAVDPSAPGTSDLERLAQLLRVDAVGVADRHDGAVRVVWWGAPGQAFPGPVEDLLSGSLADWVVAPLPDGGTAFARISSRSSVRTPAVLQTVAPIFAATLAGRTGDEQGLGEREAELASGLRPLETALAALRDDLGFETASLFVLGALGWELLVREGPVRSWHSVLGPAALEGLPDASEYRDVSAMPGIGVRLAGLGCASVAVLPVAQGGTIVLDSSVPCREGGWVERARPFLSVISIMTGPAWSTGGALRAYHEVGTLAKVFSAVQDALLRPGASLAEMLDDVRDALGAHAVVLASERGPEIEVLAMPPGLWPSRLGPEARAWMQPTNEPTLPDEAASRIAAALGLPSGQVAAALGREEPDLELILVSWGEALPLSPVSTAVVARAVSTARAALSGRRQSVVAQLDRERTRMAYALHDGLVQTVTSAVLELEALKKRFERDPGDAMTTLESAKGEIRRSLAELRSILFDLSRSSADEARVAEPITRYVEDIVRRWRLPARVTVEGSMDEAPGRALAVAYVVIREALANAAKYSGGGNVEVRLTGTDSELFVSVHDGGRGFSSEDERAAREAHHFGLEMLRRRVGEAGGELNVESNPGRGTEVRARIPYEEDRR